MLRHVIERFPMVHATIGLAGNGMFILGSLMFTELVGSRAFGVGLFVAGSSLMFIGALGDWLLRCWNYEPRRLDIQARRARRRPCEAPPPEVCAAPSPQR